MPSRIVFYFFLFGLAVTALLDVSIQFKLWDVPPQLYVPIRVVKLGALAIIVYTGTSIRKPLMFLAIALLIVMYAFKKLHWANHEITLIALLYTVLAYTALFLRKKKKNLPATLKYAFLLVAAPVVYHTLTHQVPQYLIQYFSIQLFIIYWAMVFSCYIYIATATGTPGNG